MGGSLILVPTLGLALGPKAGVATAAFLLALNNVAKITAYRKTISYRGTALVLPMGVVGAAVGARLLAAASEQVVGGAVIASLLLALVVEFVGTPQLRKFYGPVLALGAGLVSGFSGTSGPLKGAALRTLNLDRLHFVGAASLVSFAGDAIKTAVYWRFSLVHAKWILIALPLMILGTFVGRLLNQNMGELVFTGLFWFVMGAYVLRLAV